MCGRCRFSVSSLLLSLVMPGELFLALHPHLDFSAAIILAAEHPLHTAMTPQFFACNAGARRQASPATDFSCIEPLMHDSIVYIL